jgi:hypothetical protein
MVAVTYMDGNVIVYQGGGIVIERFSCTMETAVQCGGGVSA